MLDNILVQEGSLTNLEKDILNGVLSFDEVKRQKNEIRVSLLKIVRLIEEASSENEEVKNELSSVTIGNTFDFSVSLNDWAKTKRGTNIIYFILFVLVLYIIAVAINVFSGGGIAKPSIWSAVIQFVFIAFACYHARMFKELNLGNIHTQVFADEAEFWNKLRLYRRAEPAPTSEEDAKIYFNRFKNGANKALTQFAHFWFFFWLTWLFFGVVVIAKHWIGGGNELIYRHSENLLNNLNTLMLIYLFLNITISTSRIPEVTWIIFAVVVGVVSFMEPLLISPMPTDQQNYAEFWIKVVIGLIAGLTLLAFLGRLSGKFMNIPILIMLTLYVYVFYQLIFPLLDYTDITIENTRHPQMTIKFTFDYIFFYSSFFSLIFKSLLFVVVTWLLDSGKMLYFIAEESSLNFKGDDDFYEFLNAVPMKENKIF